MRKTSRNVTTSAQHKVNKGWNSNTSSIFKGLNFRTEFKDFQSFDKHPMNPIHENVHLTKTLYVGRHILWLCEICQLIIVSRHHLAVLHRKHQVPSQHLIQRLKTPVTEIFSDVCTVPWFGISILPILSKWVSVFLRHRISEITEHRLHINIILLAYILAWQSAILWLSSTNWFIRMEYDITT